MNARQRYAPLPFHRGWMIALNSISGLAKRYIIENPILTFLCTRKLNQDHVENLHCMIRAKHGLDDHPNPQGYISALRCLSAKAFTSELVQVSHPAGANCEPEPWDNPKMDPLPATESEITEEIDDTLEVEDNCFEPVLLDIGATLSDIESETAMYIAGAGVRKHICLKNKCDECINLCIDKQAEITIFSKHKDFTDDSLVNTSNPIRAIAIHFEMFFQHIVQDALLAEHPRQFILSSYAASLTPDVSQLTCSIHNMDIVDKILEYYCHTRLFHAIKLMNAQLQKGKKGNELNKSRKLNL